MSIITRFAPSPTGFLHIGSARTALFNWLYTKKRLGKFYLRIEDTDKVRSTPEAIKTIIESLKWLGLNWDGEIVFQSHRQSRHKEIAEKLVSLGQAYYCYLTPEQIAEERRKSPYSKLISPWRDKSSRPNLSPNVNPVIRLRSIDSGSLTIHDTVQGNVQVNNEQLDDMILLRSDGTPTYMLAVVVDDYDMGVNYIIRGDDHLTNTFRQIQIYNAMGWELPNYAHIPLIHGEDGAKLSKRHGALGVQHYREMGYLPETLCNYLLRLGWGYGNKEILSINEAIEIFDVSDIGKSPARFDMNKINSLNAHYISMQNDEKLLGYVTLLLGLQDNLKMQEKLMLAMPQLKVRANTLLNLAANAKIYVTPQVPMDKKSEEVLANSKNREFLRFIVDKMSNIAAEDWNLENIKNTAELIAKELNIEPILIIQILRAGVIGTFNSPGIYEVLSIIGRDETIKRINEKLESNLQI